MKTLHILTLALSLTTAGCASTSRLPMPKGKPVPVNSLDTAERLMHQKGLVIAGDDRETPEVRKHLLQRPAPEENYTMVADGELIERTIIVSFDYGSDVFDPDQYQSYRLRQLVAIADRVEIRGRTDAKQNNKVNRIMAERRAIAARNHLLDIGMPSDLIAINYMASGHPIASPDNARGRAMNRRVEIEFYIDDFTKEAAL